MAILVSNRELLAVQETVRDEFRPAVWRNFMRVKRDIPPWAKHFAVQTIRGLAPEPVLENEVAPNQIPKPSLARRENIFSLFKYVLSYDYTDEEQVYATQMKINLASERAEANSRSFEEHLERIAAAGSADGLMTTGLVNLATGSADVIGDHATLVTELPKAASGNVGWYDYTTGAAVATALEMALDMCTLVDTVYNATLERNSATDIVLANKLWDVASTTVQGTDNTRTAIDIFRSMRPGVQVRRWHKLNRNTDGGVAGTDPKLLAIDSSDPQAPQMVLPQELTFGRPFATIKGFEVLQWIKTGGVVAKKPQTVAYMAPDNPSS